jgi:hypothetical protein
MNISNLTLKEVSHKMRELLPSYLQKYNDGESLFQESYSLDFDEINHNIPEKYHKYFKGNDSIQNASGIISASRFEYDYIVILLSNADYSRALFLLLQKENKATGDIEIELLNTFIPE